VMGLPFKVSTTTSNFMIGVTAAASAALYLRRGYIDPSLCWPIMLGVSAGAALGALTLRRFRGERLRLLFIIAIIFLGFQMVFHGMRML
jgi:uncharacterized protein